MPIVLFSNVKSPASQLVPTMVSCVCDGGRVGEEGVCLLISLSGKQGWLFVWSSDNFSIEMLLEQYKSNNLVPFFDVPTSPCPPFRPAQSEIRTQPISGAQDMWHLVEAFLAALNPAAFQMCSHALRARVCCRKCGSLQVSHEVKMTRKLRHKPLYKSWNWTIPRLKVLMKKIALKPEPPSLLGRNLWTIFLRPLGKSGGSY